MFRLNILERVTTDPTGCYKIIFGFTVISLILTISLLFISNAEGRRLNVGSTGFFP
jgi:hypothetical protein